MNENKRTVNAHDALMKVATTTQEYNSLLSVFLYLGINPGLRCSQLEGKIRNDKEVLRANIPYTCLSWKLLVLRAAGMAEKKGKDQWYAIPASEVTDIRTGSVL